MNQIPNIEEEKTGIEEILLEFREHLPQPERHYHVTADWKEMCLSCQRELVGRILQAEALMN